MEENVPKTKKKTQPDLKARLHQFKAHICGEKEYAPVPEMALNIRVAF
jgi:hypothetical protein